MSQFDSLIAEITQKIKAADRQPLAALRLRLQDYLPGPLLDRSMDALTYYVESCPVTLRDFAAAASDSYSESLQQVVASLYQYLVEPRDLLDDSNGILGFLDDGWLIHNTAYRCIESQLLGAERFSADWNTIVMADRLVQQLFPPHVKATLDEIAGQYSNLVAREMQQFQAPAGWGEFPAGSSGDGADSTQGKTIDDYYYTIGGTSYLSTKPVS
jgi:hypothetical protein